VLNQTGDNALAFPPNYRQERSNRARSKERKALEKQQKREEKAARRKAGQESDDNDTASAEPSDKDEN